MNVLRITTSAYVFHYWDFLEESLKSIGEKSREPFDLEFVRKTIINLAADSEHAWIGIVLDSMGIPLAFGCTQECTPQFSTERYFVVRWFYHTPGRFDATTTLMSAFEQWARDNHISRYAVTTRRSAGEAIKCFSSARYGFKKTFLTFEKEL